MLAALARDVARAEAVRDVKTLQRDYAQYAQFGLWNEMAALFAQDGTLETGADQVSSRAAIAVLSRIPSATYNRAWSRGGEHRVEWQ
jgi:hypothetical protein